MSVIEKIIPLNKIKEEIEKLKLEGKTVVATNGCFDILHVGHIRYLKQSKALGDILVVGINTDSSVKRLKGRHRPVNNENDRAEVLSAVVYVDYVIPFKEDTAENFLTEVKPDIYTKGDEYKDKIFPEKTLVEGYGGEVNFISMVENISTTNILEKLDSILS